MRPRLPTFVGLALLALLDVGVARAESAIYALDADHTYATFAIDHNGASVNRARFDEVAGSVRFDPVAKAGAVDLYVQVASVYSGSKGFDEHLLSPDLFDAARFPTLRFVSERLVFDGERLVEVPGQLTLLGRTHPVTLKARQFRCYPNQRAKTEACGGDFEAVIDRTQWGMNYLVDKGMPRNVRITATIEAFRQ
ncbi:MAG: YceI family protein [Burkholderiaceae bacterium]|jgi:polyisoprenoid-binding protein YceI|nr:YceI family protein [Pseudomonadota bacterium]MBS0595912.1 YceI family protein [Pseudomonadota bacterium]MCO5117677.1 YceI family protein [Burkholderiaceae bacterium]MCP5216543.1 YceI family protein [Burkholderiaceae bacterium]